MRKLSFIVLIYLFLGIIVSAQSPHGKDFDVECSNCHTSENWKVDTQKLDFDHAQTGFELVGVHKQTDCKTCHTTLEFSKVKQECFQCHTDVHENTLGRDCESCHTSTSWVVTSVIEIHEMRRFPLVGEHRTADCNECHVSSSKLRYEPLGVECIDCHRKDFNSTQNPNHIQAGFSTECTDCHSMTQSAWSFSSFAHDFFPLTGGHAVSNCFDCHNTGTFEGLTQECYTCHKSNYESTQSPNHVALNFPTDCHECHTTNPGWSPAEFTRHNDIYPLIGAHELIKNECQSCHTSGYENTPDQCVGCHQENYNATTNPSHTQLNFSTDCETCHNTSAWQPATFDHDNEYFPIYSGSHRGEWNECSDCHVDPNNYARFECINCHEHNQSSTDSEHNEVNGYIYNSEACYSCHPSGRGEGAFNHNTSNFPLIGGHSNQECADCHSNGYQGTSSECISCHQTNYDQTDNPNHSQLSFSQTCSDCHSVNPGWEVTQFTIHSDFYVLTGAHNNIANDCASCHNGNFNNSTNRICYDCHTTDFSTTNNPPHQTSGFSTDCESCHNTNAWQPSTFDHDGQYFPIYSGKHNGEWNVCADCHTNQSDFAVFSCIDCHEHDKSSTDSEHQGVNGYVYQSTECFACHPNGNGDGAFNHNNSNFPLTGAHANEDCQSCHQSGYANTSTQCFSCHESKFNEATDPNHQTLNFNNDCSECHSTNPGWEVTQFPIHNDFYVLTGAHSNIANDCASCHEGTYNTSSNRVCYDCHTSDFSATTNPPHQTSGFSNDCESCHNTTAWQPATFDHDGQYFPIYSGQHNNEWNTCADCHTNQNDFAVFSCIDCHEHNKASTDSEHQGVSGYVYESTECFACHPNGNGDGAFNHSSSNFPLTGAHNGIECSSCHANGYLNTSSECNSCHQNNFNETTNPDHTKLSFSDNCKDCHNTESGWQLTAFPIHDKFYTLLGAHQEVQNDCNSCHNGDYNTQHDVCLDCHNSDYNNASNPNHAQLSFSNNCDDCHNSNRGWELTSFTIHSQFYALTGAHANIANNCADCHNNDYNNTTDVCYDCHITDYQSATNPSHAGSSFPTDCQSCHTTSVWNPSTFNHDGQYFPIYSGEHNNEWNLCADCHTNQNDFGVFSCIDCHEHSKSRMDSEHLGEVNNYTYESTACYDCHPNGNGDKTLIKTRRVKWKR